LVAILEPEELEWLLALILGHFEESVQVAIPLCCIAVVNVWHKGDDADDGALAILRISLLLENLVQLRLDICLVKQVISECSD
jgi:hypothetical protein